MLSFLVWYHKEGVGNYKNGNWLSDVLQSCSKRLPRVTWEIEDSWLTSLKNNNPSAAHPKIVFDDFFATSYLKNQPFFALIAVDDTSPRLWIRDLFQQKVMYYLDHICTAVSNHPTLVKINWKQCWSTFNSSAILYPTKTSGQTTH